MPETPFERITRLADELSSEILQLRENNYVGHWHLKTGDYVIVRVSTVSEEKLKKILQKPSTKATTLPPRNGSTFVASQNKCDCCGK